MLALAGCAGHAPVPGGDDRVNSDFYDSPDDFLRRVRSLHPGMTHAQVFATLGHNPAEMNKLSRAEITGALYGSSSAQFDGTLAEQEQARRFLQSLYGYRLVYADVEREHGFSSPIRIRTEEGGFKYTVLLIFQNGILFDQPILSGGVVNDSSSRTLFDVLNPLGMINKQIF
jgi:hypothetical protein